MAIMGLGISRSGRDLGQCKGQFSLPAPIVSHSLDSPSHFALMILILRSCP